MTKSVKPNNQIMYRKGNKTENTDDTIEGQVIDGKSFDPKKIEKTDFHHNQRVKIIDGFYKGLFGTALDRKVRITLVGAVISYQIQLDSLDIVECYPNEISAV